MSCSLGSQSRLLRSVLVVLHAVSPGSALHISNVGLDEGLDEGRELGIVGDGVGPAVNEHDPVSSSKYFEVHPSLTSVPHTEHPQQLHAAPKNRFPSSNSASAHEYCMRLVTSVQL